MQVHQLLGSLEYGDAVAGYALTVQRLLRERGHESEIFVPACDPRVAHLCHPLEAMPLALTDAAIYHHTFLAEATLERVRRHTGRRVLIYHNVTPDHYFAGYSDELREGARRAREQLAELRPLFDVAVAVSGFNRTELEAAGFADVAILPVPVALDRLAAVEPDPAVLDALGDGLVNFLFVGRLVPSKRQDDLIRVFAWYTRLIHGRARLLLVGAAPEIDDYRRSLERIASDCGVVERVAFTGKISDSALVACYRRAHLFLCLSEHEGFCVPLLEAMRYDVPVLARAAGAIPETLGGSGVLVRGRNLPEIAEAAHLLISDEPWRARVITSQRERLDAFPATAFEAGLDAVLARLSS